ncbi:hypothetical protein GA0111570_103214 [Raineyella antarctica]|uniref:Septum formation n=1 Tax=Raineyella antarctica TaxID=1577474 RepID=A0A1G6GH82_9ACTN|nr:hypothetical protein [Raineyella antarctica]SDB81115.1 hypothetical protein GA0111570_103214 [Raineyella antarctica]
MATEATRSWRRGVLVALAALLLPLAGCDGGSGTLLATPKPRTPPPATMVHIQDVRTGMCLDADRLPAGGRIAYLEVLGCATEHNGEVFAVEPGAGTPEGIPDGKDCWAAYQGYVGTAPDRTQNQIRALTASADALAADRSAPLVCVAVTPSATTASLQGSGT